MLTAASRNSDFPSLAGKVYLNTAAEGIPPRAVLDALRQYGQDKLVGMDGRELHRVQWQQAKQLVARFYGLSSSEVSLCSCSSEAYNLAAMALRMQEGDEVVVSDLDYPSGVTPFLQSGCAAKVKVWRNRQGALRVEDLAALLGSRTRLVSLSLVSFYNGFMLPLREVAEAVRRHSPALIALDVTQALGRVPMQLNDVDLIVSSTHKWILASHGGGLVGVPAARAGQWTVPAGGWFNLKDPFSPERFDRPAVSLPGAAGFSVGMPNYPAIYAIRAALQYIGDVGVAAIHAHARPLVRAAIDELKKLPVELITPDEPGTLAGIIAFRHPDSEHIHRVLHGRNIHVMHQAGRVRISIHGYNTADDVQTFVAALKETLNHD